MPDIEKKIISSLLKTIKLKKEILPCPSFKYHDVESSKTLLLSQGSKRL
jgi:hypothetical protein